MPDQRYITHPVPGPRGSIKAQPLAPIQDKFEGPFKLQSSPSISGDLFLQLHCSSPSLVSFPPPGLTPKGTPQFISCLRVCFLREPGLQQSLRHDSAEKLKHRCPSHRMATGLLRESANLPLSSQQLKER